MTDLRSAAVRRAKFLADEARIAADAGRADASDWLKHRAAEYLCGRIPTDSSTPATP